MDSRSDIFSFGSTVYEMVTGKAPFNGPTHQDTLASILRDEPLSPHDFNPAVPGELSRIISRCLHKKPEGRYNDTRDLVAALRDLQAVSTSTGTQPLAKPSRRWGRIVVATSALVAIVAIAIVKPWEHLRKVIGQNLTSTADAPDRPNWILVADLDGPPDNPTLATATRELLVASLTYSKVVTPLSADQVARVLELAMRPDTTRVQGEVAREVAVRAGAKVFVEGRIDRVMSGFAIVLHIEDAVTRQHIFSVHGSAASHETLIPTLDELGRQVREQLGEKKIDVKSTLPMIEAMTPSFDAYRELVLADEVKKQGLGMQSQLDHLRRALQLDPDFSEAWLAMSRTYSNYGHLDSAGVALQEAEKRPERFTAERLLYLRAKRARLDGDVAEQLRLYDLLLTHDPFNPDYLNNRANALNFLGRKKEALIGYERADSLSFGAWAFVANNVLRMHIALGQYDPDSLLRARLEPGRRRAFDLIIALAQSKWSESEKLATGMIDDPTTEYRGSAQTAMGSLMALRGQVGEAFSYFEVNNLMRSADLLRLVTRGLYEYPSIVSPDTTGTRSLLLIGLQAALQNDVNGALRILEIVRTRTDGRLRHSTDSLVLEACILMVENNWREVPQLLERFTTSGFRPWLFGRLPVRWVVAVAYEELEQLEHATEAFELVLLPTYLSYEETRRPIFWSFAHHRLVLLYSKMGRVEDARRHWKIFEKTFTNPDPELRPMIEEAREALAEAEAKASS